MAHRSFGRFRQASTHLDTPPSSLSHHPISDIAHRGRLRCSVMTDWNDLPEQLQLRLTSAAMTKAALMVATLAEALAEELEITGEPDQDGSSALRALAREIRTPGSSRGSGPIGH